MDIPAAITDLVDPNKYANIEWKKLPPGSATPLTAAQKAEYAAREAAAGAHPEAFIAAHPENFQQNTESHSWNFPNVATLPPESIADTIGFVQMLIQNGQAKNADFYSGNGDQQTRSIDQYLGWLQQRAVSDVDDGTYSLKILTSIASQTQTSSG